MKFNVEKYNKGVSYISSVLNDLSKSYQDNNLIRKNYICIPLAKKEKNSLTFNIHDVSTNHYIELSIASNGAIAKVFDKDYNFLYDYSVYQNGEVRTKSINFANKIGATQKININSKGCHVLETSERIPLKNLVNLEDYSNSAEINKLFAFIRLEQENNGSIPVAMSFGIPDDNNNRSEASIALNHEELLSIRRLYY